MLVKRFILMSAASLALSCNEGLRPDIAVQPGFGGTIRFAPGPWPPLDSLVNLWVMASQIYPLDSVSIFAGLFSDPPKIYRYPTDKERIAYSVDSVEYYVPLPPALYKYVCVVQHINSSLDIRSFRVVGVYQNPLNPSQPGSVSVFEGQSVAGIMISVDFRNLPPQPF